MKTNQSLKKSTQVLRDTALVSQPHTLIRPTKSLSSGFAHKVSDRVETNSIFGTVNSNTDLISAQKLTTDRYQEGFSLGMAEGKKRAEAEYQEAQREFEAKLSAERQKTLEDAYKEGLSRGLNEAASQIEERVKKATEKSLSAVDERLQRIDHFLNSIPLKIQDYYDGFEDDMVAICVSSIVKIIGELIVKPEVIKTQIRHYSQEFKNEICQICMHPDDYQAVLLSLENEKSSNYVSLSEMKVSGRIELIADSDIKYGGILLRSNTAKLDVQIDTQMNLLCETLLRERSRQLIDSKS